MSLVSCSSETPFTLEGTTSVEGIISYNRTTITFTPKENLLPETTYTVTVSAKLKNQVGLSLENNYIWSFTTMGNNNNHSVEAHNKTVKI